MSFVKNLKPNAGDLLRVKRKAGYYHFGIAANENEVIHFSGTDGDNVLNPENIRIIKTSLESFLRGDILEINHPYSSPYDREKTVKRAGFYIGKSKFKGKHYNLVTNNCEHFARHCYDGKKISKQVRTVATTVIGATVAITTAIATNVLLKKSKKR